MVWKGPKYQMLPRCEIMGDELCFKECTRTDCESLTMKLIMSRAWDLNEFISLQQQSSLAEDEGECFDVVIVEFGKY